MARVTHLADLMHRAEASNGTAIPSNWILSTDGTKALAWRPETSASGSVSYGSNATHVSDSSDGGAAANASRSDHRHLGVRSVAHSSNTMFGDVTFQTEGSLYIVKPGPGILKFGSTSSGGSGGAGTITTKDEGSTLSSTVTTLDFVGAGVTASGSGATTTVTIPGGGGGSSPSYLGYNTVGGSTQAMTSSRLYAKQITAGSGGNVLLGVQAYLDITAEAISTWAFALFADSGSDTIGDLLATNAHGNASGNSISVVFARAAGNYPARWYGQPLTYALAASTKYWVGLVWFSGTANPRLYYDSTGTDRYFTLGASVYIPDGAYVAQTDTTNKHSIRALVL